MTALLVDAVVRDGRIHICDEFYKSRADRYAKKLGEGRALRIRIEPEEEAVRLDQVFAAIDQALSDGRLTLIDKEIHHIDGNPRNNDLSNLEVRKPVTSAADLITKSEVN